MENIVNIKIIGVGGAGENAVARMIADKIEGVEYVTINTDTKAAGVSAGATRIGIGQRYTNGLGTGARPEVGKLAAEDDREKIAAALAGCDMVFITAGMGGGVGGGASPVIAEIAKKMGVLTVAVVTKPFMFEGRRRMTLAEEGIASLSANVDAIMVIPNDNLKHAAGKQVTLANAFALSDSVLSQTVANMIELIQKPAFINSDFADVTAVLKDSGRMHVGFCKVDGTDSVNKALAALTTNKLLDTKITGASAVLLSVSVSPSIAIDEVDEISAAIRDLADEDANIIFGLRFDEELDDGLRAMIVATGV